MQPIETAMRPEYREITETSRPIGKCLLLTRHGTTVVGFYDGHPDYVAYAGLPRIPDYLKEKLSTKGQGDLFSELEEVES